MIPNKFCQNILRTSLRHLNAKLYLQNARNCVNYCHFNTKYSSLTLPVNLTQCRSYSERRVLLPALSDHPPLLAPSFFKTMRGIFQYAFVIKALLDSTFDMKEFLDGSKQALTVVSNALAREDYDSLEGLVTNDVIQNLKNKISTLSPEQKALIAVNPDDVYALFPYEVGIMFEKGQESQKFVEITVVFHTLRGIHKNLEKNQPVPLMEFLPTFQENSLICNYRFIREFTKGVESSWTINMINQFMPEALA